MTYTFTAYGGKDYLVLVLDKDLATAMASMINKVAESATDEKAQIALSIPGQLTIEI